MPPSDLDELDSLYATGRLIICVGPDLSVAAGLPSPLDLARTMSEQLREENPHTDFLELDQALATGMDDRALGILRHRFGEGRFVREVKHLLESDVGEAPDEARRIAGVAAGLHAVYTTSLDRTLERAFGGRWWIATEGRQDLAGRRRALVKLCGTTARKESWVLTTLEFQRAYGAHDIRRLTLEAAYRSFPILFVGFDQGPALLDRLLNAVSPAIVGDDPPKHFLAASSGRWGDDTRRGLEERGIRPIDADAVWAWLHTRAQKAPERSLVRTRPEVDPRFVPYPGLEPYTEVLADVFFGREVAISEAIGKLGGPPGHHRRWLSIEGPSGVGKSSFVRAGLVRAARLGQIERGPEQWIVLVMRPGKRPLNNLAAELCKVLGVEGVAECLQTLQSEHGLSAFLREHVVSGHGLLLVVDQLEELLTYSELEQREAFASALADGIADVEGLLYLITTLRSDFVDDFTAAEFALNLHDGGGRYPLPSMDREDLKEAIVGPARDRGIHVQPALIEQLLADAEGNRPADSSVSDQDRRRSNDEILPLVAHVLRELWIKEGTQGSLTLEAYRDLGGIAGALTNSADQVLEALPKKLRALAREVLLMLVNVDPGGRDTRQVRSREELLEKAGGGEAGLKLLMHLSGNVEGDGGERVAMVRLITLDNGDRPRVDLIHEALTQSWKTMRRWLARRRKQLVARDDLIRNVRRWKEQKRPWLGLPGGAELKWMLEVEAENDDQRAYQRALRINQRVQMAMLATVAVALVSLAVTSFVLYSRERKLLERNLLAQALLAEKLAFTDEDLQKLQGSAEVRIAILEIARTLSELAVGDPDDPKLLRATMLNHDARGDVEWIHERLHSARDEFQKAKEIAQKLTKADPNNLQYQRDLSVSLNKLGNVEAASGRLELARAHYAAALSILRHLAEADPSNAHYRWDISITLERLGDVEAKSAQFEQARAYYHEALSILRQLAEMDPSSVEFRRDLRVSLGDAEVELGRLDRARAHYEEALSIDRALAKAEPSSVEYQQNTSISLGKLGEVEAELGRIEDARAHYGESLVVVRALAWADPGSTQYWRDVSVSLDRLGQLVKQLDELELARHHFEDALEIDQWLAAMDPSNSDYQFNVVVGHLRLIQLEGASNEIEVLGHIIAAKQILDEMERKGQIEGNKDRMHLRELINLPGETRAIDATVISTDLPELAPEAACRLTLTHVPDNDPACHASLICGGILLYGTLPSTGWRPCTWAAELQWSDEATDDGDPALVVDTHSSTFSLWDDPRDDRKPFSVSGRLLVAPEKP